MPLRGAPLDRWRDAIPDVRDGLTRAERVVLATLADLQRERAGRAVPMPLLYGRVLERLGPRGLSTEALQRIVERLGARSDVP